METIKELLIPILTSLIASGGVSGIFMYYLKKKDRVSQLEKITDRQAEGIAVMTEAFLVLIEALHKRGLVNGESEHIRQDLEDYLFKCTENGLYVKREDK